MVGHYERGTLDGSIEDAIDDFRRLRDRAFVADDADQVLTAVERMANLLLDTADDLTAEKQGWDNEELWRAFRTLFVNDARIRPHIVEQLQIALALKHAPTSQEMANRVLDLTTEVLPRKPDALVLKYIKLLTRTYVAGFFAESLMVCGSVLEQEIKATFARKNIRLPATGAGVSSMKTRVEAAHQFRWLTAKGKRDALQIWHRRNQTTHYDPELVKQARETVGMTVGVLQELARVR